MIELYEQYGYKREIRTEDLKNLSDFPSIPKDGIRVFKKKKEDGICFKYWRVGDKSQFHFQTSYYVGVDWIVEGQKALYVAPKQNDETVQINYLKMLIDALEEESNTNHLDELFEVDFDKPFIEIQQSQDLLTPLLIYQYLTLLKKIVQKGLRKSYYKVDRNLNARVKGKVLVNQTIKQNLIKSKNTSTVCRFEEFGVNSTENKVLKKAFEFSRAILANHNFNNKSSSSVLCAFIEPALQKVSNEVSIMDLKHIKPNPLFPEYEQALRLAKIILRKYGYSISKTTETKVMTPPFWIDMSKLFELYIYSKLKKEFPLPGEVTYHKTFNRLEPDFILKSRDNQFKMVIDAKYKPKYQDGKVDIADIRQISAYARMESVSRFLEIQNRSQIISCLVIYSHQNASTELNKLEFKINKESDYIDFYKIGIRLPVKEEVQTG